MISRIEDIVHSLKIILPVIREEYFVENLEIFGSYVRNEQNKKSDLDILVTFTKTPGMFRFIELENYLSDKLGIKVDLVMKDVVKPELRSSIMSDSVRI